MSADDPQRRFEQFRHRTMRELEYQRRSGRLAPEEFDRRVALARRAASVLDLRPLLEDLARPPDRVATAPTTTPARLADHDPRGDSDLVFALMSGGLRAGHWAPSRTVYAVAIMGGVKLDFREADLLEGTTRVHAHAVMGSVMILVPPDVHLVVKGIGLMGGFGRGRRTSPPANAPCLRIDGLALMGGVEVKVREPGERSEDESR